MKKFAFRVPFVFGILVSLAAVLGQVWPLWLPGLSQNLQVVAARITDLLIAVVLLSLLGWWREAGFIRFESWRVLLPYLPLILVDLLILGLLFTSSRIQVTDPVLIVFGLASFTVGGFVEEALFRGVVLRSFLPGGLMKAAFLSALVFSLAHLPNMLVGQSVSQTALQLARAFLVGFAFVAPLAYTRNIWPLVILHTVINFSSFLASGNITLIATQAPSTSQVVMEIAIFGLLAVYGFWLLRRAGQKAAKTLVVEPEIS